MGVVSARTGLLAMIAGLIGIVALTVAPYRGNVTSLFHMDDVLRPREMPAGFVILDVPAYDGAQYYDIARNIPLLADAGRWDELRERPPQSYGYQRLLLPLFSFLLSLGSIEALPYVFLAINLGSLACAAWLFLSVTQPSRIRWVYPAALAFSPAALVGLHFMLAEPLTLLITTAFLVRFVQRDRLGWVDMILLALLPLSREVTILFIGLLLLYLSAGKRWRDLPYVLPAMLAFFLHHGLLYLIFGEWPFFMSAEKSTLPFEAVFRLLTGGYGYNRLTLTSIPLFLLFVLPALAWIVWLVLKKKDRSFLTIGSGAFLLLMISMPDHIVGSITSIGRVITPVYPLFLLTALRYDSRTARLLASSILLLGLGAGISLASVVHPYHLT